MATMTVDPDRKEGERRTGSHFGNRRLEPEFSRSQISLLVVDAQEIVGVGFRLLLGGQPWVKRCIHATDANQAFEHARRYQPHVALIAAEIAESAEAALVDEIRRVSPGTRALLTLNAPSISGQTLKSIGVSGFISKLWPVQDSVAVIRAAGLGLEFASALRDEGGVNLSAREHDVLTRIAMGETNREIAAALYLSPHTVKQHASAAFRKIQARNRTEAVDRARRLGLIA